MPHFAFGAEFYSLILIFARVGSFFAVLPGLNEAVVPQRLRLSLALLLSAIIYPVVRNSLAVEPDSVIAMVLQLIEQMLIGFAMGLLLAVFLMVFDVTGEVISLQTTLAFAQTSNPLEARPTTAVTGFLTLIGVVLIMTTDLHRMFLVGLVHSFQILPKVHLASFKDFVAMMIKDFSDSFSLGIMLAAPALVFGLVFQIATGLIARIMPQFQAFFATQPLMILLGLSILGLSLGSLGLIWVDKYRHLASVWL